MSGQTDSDARAVLGLYGLSAALTESLGNRGGFSGARIWRVRADRGALCLKAWPPSGMLPARHAEISRLISHACAAGLTFVPRVWPTADGRTSVSFADRTWD